MSSTKPTEKTLEAQIAQLQSEKEAMATVLKAFIDAYRKDLDMGPMFDDAVSLVYPRVDGAK